MDKHNKDHKKSNKDQKKPVNKNLHRKSDKASGVKTKNK